MGLKLFVVNQVGDETNQLVYGGIVKSLYQIYN